MSEYIQVMTAVDNEEDAQNIASAIVSQRLAASVQIVGPVNSTFWWNNDVETSAEWLCLIKTRADLFAELEALIQQVHPYDVPELLALPIVAGGKSYLTWLDRETKRPAP